MSATSTPICNTASTASCCPTASAPSARSSTPALSAAWRCSPARCRRNTACAPPACSTSRPNRTPSTIPARVSVYGGSHGTITPQHRIWRHGRTDAVFRVGPFHAEQSRHRKSDAGERGDSRSHLAGKGFPLSLDRARSDQPPHLHERRLQQHLPDPEQSRPDVRTSPRSASRTSIQRCSTSTRTSSTSSMSWPTRNRPAISTTRSPISTATAQLHFYPDPIGDLVFNGVASDVYRQSVVNGIQQDTAWRWGFAHTLRFGFTVSAERSLVNNGSTLLPLADPNDPTARHHRRAVLDLRFRREDRHDLRHLCPGRVEDQQPVDAECRAPLRPDVAIRRRQPVQPARQPDLEAAGRHHLPCRLCPQLHAAAAGDRLADQPRAGDAATAPPTRSRRKCRSTARCSRNARMCSTPAWCRRSIRSPASRSGSTATTRSRATCSTTASSARPMC